MKTPPKSQKQAGAPVPKVLAETAEKKDVSRLVDFIYKMFDEYEKESKIRDQKEEKSKTSKSLM